MDNTDISVSFGADTTDLNAGAQRAKGTLSEFTQTVANFGRTASSVARNDTESLSNAIKQLNQHASLGSSLLEGMRGAALSMAGVAAAAFSVEKMKEWLEQTAKAGNNIESFAAKVGTSFSEIQNVQGIATLSGASPDAIVEGLRSLQTELGKDKESAKGTVEALNAIGLSFDSLRGKSPTQLLEAIAGAMSRYADGANKTAVATKLLGAAGGDMIRELDQGKAGIQELEAEVSRSGMVMSDAAVQAASQTQHHLRELAMAWNANLGAGIMGAADAAVVGVTRLIESIDYAKVQEAAKKIGDALIDAGAGVTEFFVRLMSAWDALLAHFGLTTDEFIAKASAASGKMLEFLNNMSGQNGEQGHDKALHDAGAAVDWLGGQFEDVARRIAASMLEARDKIKLMHGEMSQADFDKRRAELGGVETAARAAGAAGKEAGEAIAAGFNGAGISADVLKFRLAEIKSTAEGIKNAFNQMAGGLTTAKSANAAPGPYDYTPSTQRPGAPTGPQVRPIGLSSGGGSGSDEETQMMRAVLEREVDAAREAYQEIQDHLNGLVHTHAISMDTWLKQSTAALDREQDAIQDAYEKAKQTSSLSTAERIQLATREEKEIAAASRRLTAMQQRAADESMRSWERATSEINSAFTGQIDGLLRGTTSWAQAVRNVLASLTESIITFFVQWGLKAVENQMLQLAAQNQVTAGILASLGLQGAAQVAASKPSAIASIQTDVGQAFAGFAAFLAPMMGPAAIGAAAGLAAEVDGTAMGLAAADIGMWRVPGDQLAMIHKNELVATPAQADAIRAIPGILANGGGEDRQGRGGDRSSPSYTHIGDIISNASDPREVAREVVRVLTRNPSMRPGY